MPWQFEWNWLGYVWGFFVLFPLTLASVLAISEGRDAARGKTPTGSVYGHQIMVLLGMFGAVFLGVLTIFFWGWKTALMLLGGAVAWSVLILFLFALVERLFK